MEAILKLELLKAIQVNDLGYSTMIKIFCVIILLSAVHCSVMLSLMQLVVN